MRIRTIKPEFFEDEKLAELPPHDRLFFIGLWCLADKNGVVENRPAFLKAKIFPYEYGETTDVSQMLPRLSNLNLIQMFTYEGRGYLAITSFKKHQRITGKEAVSPARYPFPDKELRKEKQQGNIGETPETTGKGIGNRERERNKPPVYAPIGDIKKEGEIPELPKEPKSIFPSGIQRKSKADQHRTRVLRNDDRMIRIGKWFGRKADTLWTCAEALTLHSLNPPEDEVALLEAHYTDPRAEYLRKNVDTLLNNWSGELDRARARKGTPNQPTLFDHSLAEPVGWQDAILSKREEYASDPEAWARLVAETKKPWDSVLESVQTMAVEVMREARR